MQIQLIKLQKKNLGGIDLCGRATFSLFWNPHEDQVCVGPTYLTNAADSFHLMQVLPHPQAHQSPSIDPMILSFHPI